jgi:hypothetical protein
MRPIALTDLQLTAVFDAARPLAVASRDAFLFDLAAALTGITDPGDGDVARAIRAVQRKYFDPPVLDGRAADLVPRHLGPAVGARLHRDHACYDRDGGCRDAVLEEQLAATEILLIDLGASSEEAKLWRGIASRAWRITDYRTWGAFKNENWSAFMKKSSATRPTNQTRVG